MSDSTPLSRTGTGGLPPATVYDPAGGGRTPLADEPTGTVVVLLAAAAEREWAADVAVELSTGWARGGQRVVLADLHLESPILHERVGAPNLEGVVDVFLYGASIARSARPVGGRGFYLITAGTYEPDADAIYRHPRWPKLVAGFRDASASLVLFAPADSADLDALADWASEVVLLGEPDDPEVLAPFRARGSPVRAWLVPVAVPEPEPQGEFVEEFEDEPAGGYPDDPEGWPELEPLRPGEPREEPPTEERVVSSSGIDPAVLEAEAEAEKEEEDLSFPPISPRSPRERRSRASGVLVLMLVLLVLAGAALLLARLRPDLLPWAVAERSPAERPAAEAAPPPPAPTRVGEPIPYSVQVKAFTSLPAAQRQLEVEQRRYSESPFFISPEEIQGILYYKILSGLLPDTVAATRLREQLVAVGAVDREDALGSWSLIQTTPLAFDLGEFATAEAAAARADSLRQSQIPSYRVGMPYSDGSRRWQLYAGAYRDSVSAEALRRQLAQAGLTPRLVLRLGEPTAGEP